MNEYLDILLVDPNYDNGHFTSNKDKLPSYAQDIIKKRTKTVLKKRNKDVRLMLGFFKSLSKALFGTRYALVTRYNGTTYISKIWIYKTLATTEFVIYNYRGEKVVVNSDGTIPEKCKSDSGINYWKEII